MAGRIKVDEIANQAGSGSVSFPTGGADFSGNVNINGSLSATSVSASISLKNYSDTTLPSTATTGTIIWNTTQLEVQVWDGTAWVKLNNPYKDVDATSFECFWDGAADQVSGNTWYSKKSHPNVSNANCTMTVSYTHLRAHET